MHRLKVFAIALFSVVGVAMAQVSPWTVKPFAPISMTATGQTSAVVSMLSPGTGTGNSFSVGSITVTGTGLTTATFGVLGSTDSGATYFPLPLSPIATPGTTALTQTVTASGGIFQVNLATITNIKFVTSGTFTATALQLLLSASPNGLVARQGGTGGGGSTIPPNMAGTSITDFIFANNSGTTVTDVSGNNNDGTLLSGHLPTWVQNGLSFTAISQAVQLPAAVNAAMTYEYGIYINPIPATAGVFQANQFPVLMTSSLGATGLNILYAGKVQGLYALQTFSNGGAKSTSLQSISGFHILTVVLGVTGTTLDHLYIDGVEYAYASQQASSGFQTSGNLFLGSSGLAPYGSSGILGTMYRFRAVAEQLTPAQVLSDAVAITSQTAARGVPVTPQPIIGTGPILHAIGDSITCAWNGACSQPFSWAAQLSLTNQPAYTVSNWGIFNATLEAMQGSEANRVAPRCMSNNGPTPAIVFAGTNSLLNLTATQTMQYLASEIQILKQAGCRVFVGTMISRTGNSNIAGTPTMDAQKNAYDALVLSQSKRLGADGIVDFAANPLMGADGANLNSTFSADHVHPSASGQAAQAVAASNALNYYFGFNLASPNVITATTYQMLSGDGAVTAAPTANAAYTLPDCTGPSGEPYTINNPQSAFTLSVIGKASQPINGVATAIPIPSNSTATLRVVANPKTVSGCQWAM